MNACGRFVDRIEMFILLGQPWSQLWSGQRWWLGFLDERWSRGTSPAVWHIRGDRLGIWRWGGGSRSMQWLQQVLGFQCCSSTKAHQDLLRRRFCRQCSSSRFQERRLRNKIEQICFQVFWKFDLTGCSGGSCVSTGWNKIMKKLSNNPKLS